MAERPIVSDGLFGRVRFSALLTELLAGDDGAALVLRGEPGIGRSACLVAAAAMAVPGRPVLATAGSRSETHLRFAGLHRLLRPLLRCAGGLPDNQQRTPPSDCGMPGAGTASWCASPS